MLEEKLTIDNKEYTVRSQDWDSETLKEAAAQLEQGILYYKQTKDELSAVVLAALAFAYDSVSNSKSINLRENPSKSEEYEKALQKILQKISTHIQSPANMA
ncbi:MAG: cell division protein ZapA [Chitinivibrionia bacterium]|nr:cell division protein ZapA [Chitinivibrionia bacterium]